VFYSARAALEMVSSLCLSRTEMSRFLKSCGLDIISTVRLAPQERRVDIYAEIDGVVKGSPACHRAVLETVEALRKTGHDCVEIESPDCEYCRSCSAALICKKTTLAARALQLFGAITSSDKYKKLTEHLGPDKKA